MIFVTKDFGEFEGEEGYKFFPDIESAKIEMSDEKQAFYAYYQDGTIEQFSETGEMIARYRDEK